MERPKNIIYIPYWIAGMLERNNLPLSDVLNYSKMSQFLSLQEQANMLCMQNLRPFDAKRRVQGHADDQQRFEPCFESGSCIASSVPEMTTSEVSYQLAMVWRNSIGTAESANNNGLVAALRNADALAYSDLCKDALVTRMQPENAGPLTHTQVFNTYDVEREVLLVVIYPSFFKCETYARNAFDLLCAVLKVLYAYNSYASVCKTPYFRKYLEKLA